MKKILSLLLPVLAITPAFSQIRVKQTLQISITGVPTSEQARLNSAYPVSNAGFIEMWKIGKVKAAGLSEGQLATNIASKFRAAQIYSSPVFQVLNGDAASEKLRRIQLEESKEATAAAVTRDTKTYTIGGEVKGAGQQQWKEGMTLYTALQSAGGETTFGAINRVKLYRNDQVYTYNLNIDRHKGVKIYPKDLIDVPKRNWLNK